MNAEVADHPNPNRWWFHRRLMAYGAGAGVVGITLLSGPLGLPDEPAVAGIWACAFVVVGYFGNCAFEAFAGAKR